MRQKLALLCLGMLLAFALPARAEHRLLVTDVLDAGQFQAEADFTYAYSNNDFKSGIVVGTLSGSGYDETRLTGRENRKTFGSTYSLGAGLGYGLQVNVNIPYKFVDDIDNSLGNDFSFLTGFWRPDYHKDGFGDVTTGLKYRIFTGEKLPLVVTAELGAKFNTAGSTGSANRVVGIDHILSGSTDISPCLAVSTAISSDIRPYASYRATLRNNGNNDSHALSIGAQYEMTPVVTLNPSFSATFQTDSMVLHSYQSYDLALQAYLQVAKNLYLLPNLGFGISTSASTKGRTMTILYGDLETEKSFTAGLGLYYFFE